MLQLSRDSIGKVYASRVRESISRVREPKGKDRLLPVKWTGVILNVILNRLLEYDADHKSNCLTNGTDPLQKRVVLWAINLK